MRKKEEKIQEVYSFIEAYVKENGYSPSLREICMQCNIKSTSTASDYVNKLISEGLLTKKDNQKRTLNTLGNRCEFYSAPIVGKITAGNPILAVEDSEGYYPVPAEFGDDTFILRVSGTSMIDAGIYDGDKIIVRKQNTADNGDIVVALTEDCATVKTFYKRDGKFILHPENPTMEDIVLSEVAILGKVIGLIRKL